MACSVTCSGVIWGLEEQTREWFQGAISCIEINSDLFNQEFIVIYRTY